MKLRTVYIVMKREDRAIADDRVHQVFFSKKKAETEADFQSTFPSNDHVWWTEESVVDEEEPEPEEEAEKPTLLSAMTVATDQDNPIWRACADILGKESSWPDEEAGEPVCGMLVCGEAAIPLLDGDLVKGSC